MCTIEEGEVGHAVASGHGGPQELGLVSLHRVVMCRSCVVRAGKPLQGGDGAGRGQPARGPGPELESGPVVHVMEGATGGLCSKWSSWRCHWRSQGRSCCSQPPRCLNQIDQDGETWESSSPEEVRFSRKGERRRKRQREPEQEWGVCLAPKKEEPSVETLAVSKMAAHS